MYQSQRVTRVGVLYITTTTAVSLTAFLSANNLLFLLLAAMLATLLLSGFVSRLTLAGLELDFQLPDHIPARRKVLARIAARNHKSLMPSFSICLRGIPPTAFSSTTYFPVIPRRSSAEATVEVEFGRRGRHTEDSFQLSTRFPFGFTDRSARVTLQREILVYPCLDSQQGFEEMLAAVNGEMEARQRGRGHDFYRIRPYEQLESARHVDWKATAHTGELQVREFARDQDPLVELFLDLDVPENLQDWFERAVDGCAFLVWRLSQREARVNFRTQEFECRLPAEGDAYTVLKYLALVAPKSGPRVLIPEGEYGLQVVFSSRPRQVVEKGWSDALLVGPDDLSLGGPADGAGDAGSIASGAHLDHGG